LAASDLGANVFRLLSYGLLAFVAIVILLGFIPPREPEAWSEAGANFAVQLPASAVWERLQNLRLAEHYVPGVEGLAMLTDADRGVGASRRIFQDGGVTLDETVVEWEEGAGFVIRLHQGQGGPPPPFRNARFRYWIESSDESGTELSLTMLYQPSAGLLGEWLDSAFFNEEMNRRMESLASSMKAYYESSARVR